MTNPKFDIFTQFLRYPTVFSNTILKDYARNTIQNPALNAPKAVAFASMATNVAKATNYWRASDERREIYDSEDGDWRNTTEAMQRVGLLGPLEYVKRYSEAVSYGQGPLTGVLNLGGPVLGDTVGMFFYNRGLLETAARKIPLIGVKNIFDREVGDLMEQYTGFREPYTPLKEAAKERDKKRKDFIKRIAGSFTGVEPNKLTSKKLTTTRLTKFEGGRVSKDYPVPNVKEEPSEMINKATGQPYEAEMERLGFAEGKEVNNDLRLDGTKKSKVGWKGPIKSKVTGKIHTELSIGGGENEPFYPLINPYTTEEQLEHLKNNDYEGKAGKLKETEIGREMLNNAIKHYEESVEKGISPFVNDDEERLGFNIGGYLIRLFGKEEQTKEEIPIEEITIDYDNIKTDYERSQEFNKKRAEYWEKEDKRTWDKVLSLPIGSPEREITRQKNKIAWEKSQQYLYDEPRKLKYTPLSETDLSIYLGREKNPDKKEYYTKVYNKQKEDISRRKRGKEKATYFPGYGPDRIDDRLNMDVTGSEIVDRINAINQSFDMPDQPTVLRGERFLWDVKDKKLVSVSELEDQGAYQRRYDSDPKEIVDDIRVARLLEQPILFRALLPDQKGTLMGRPTLQGVYKGNEDRIEWLETQGTKTHELLHRFVDLTGMTDSIFEGKHGDEEMFIRVYTDKIYGKPLNVENLKEASKYGIYHNRIKYKDEKGRTKYKDEPVDVDSFIKKLPNMIKKFEEQTLAYSNPYDQSVRPNKIINNLINLTPKIELLDFAAVYEGDYNSMNKGTKGGKIIGSTDNASEYLGRNLTEMTIREVIQAQKKGELFAAGKYQIIPSTLLQIVNQGTKEYNLNTDLLFNEQMQDVLGLTIMIGGKRPDLRDYLLGRSKDKEAAMLDLAKEFASFPVPYDVENDKGYMIIKGQSYYRGTGNKAYHDLKEVETSLRRSRNFLTEKMEK
jgi:hypothetical protein